MAIQWMLPELFVECSWNRLQFHISRNNELHAVIVSPEVWQRKTGKAHSLLSRRLAKLWKGNAVSGCRRRAIWTKCFSWQCSILTARRTHQDLMDNMICVRCTLSNKIESDWTHWHERLNEEPFISVHDNPKSKQYFSGNYATVVHNHRAASSLSILLELILQYWPWYRTLVPAGERSLFMSRFSADWNLDMRVQDECERYIPASTVTLLVQLRNYSEQTQIARLSTDDEYWTVTCRNGDKKLLDVHKYRQSRDLSHWRAPFIRFW